MLIVGNQTAMFSRTQHGAHRPPQDRVWTQALTPLRDQPPSELARQLQSHVDTQPPLQCLQGPRAGDGPQWGVLCRGTVNATEGSVSGVLLNVRNTEQTVHLAVEGRALPTGTPVQDLRLGRWLTSPLTLAPLEWLVVQAV